MSHAQSTLSIFDREFLALRGKIIEVAASLDRISRAGSVESDPRLDQVQQSLDVLACRQPATDRAERIELILSLPYEPQWRDALAAHGQKPAAGT